MDVFLSLIMACEIEDNRPLPLVRSCEGVLLRIALADMADSLQYVNIIDLVNKYVNE